jgi:transcriptional regulator with XRE-family HTH domain
MGATLGQRLRALRVERGLSQADLAGELVSPSYVSLIEAGRRSPEQDVLDGLARKLGCSAEFLETGVAPEELSEQRLQLRFAEMAAANGDLAAACQHFTTLLQRAVGEIRHAALWGLAGAEEAQNNLHDALTHVESLLEASRRGEPGAPGLLQLENARCRIHRLAGDFTRSIEIGEAALRQIRDLGLNGTEDEIQLASTIVGSLWSRGDKFAAQHLAAEVITRAEALGSRKAQGQVYWNACVLAADRGQLALALDLAAKTLALLSESAPDFGPAGLAGMRVTYAWLLLKLEPPNIDEADTALARAHVDLTETAYGPALASCETEMARSALLKGDLADTARIAAQVVERAADGGGTSLQLARVLSGLALILGGQPDEGAFEVSDAAASLDQAGARTEAAQAWRDLAEALLQCGKSEPAIDALRRAADCAGARSSSIRVGRAAPVRG